MHLVTEEDDCTSGGGHWVTIKGTHVCIKQGETPEQAFKRTTGKELEPEGEPKDLKTPSDKVISGEPEMDPEAINRLVTRYPPADQEKVRALASRIGTYQTMKITQELSYFGKDPYSHGDDYRKFLANIRNKFGEEIYNIVRNWQKR